MPKGHTTERGDKSDPILDEAAAQALALHVAEVLTERGPFATGRGTFKLEHPHGTPVIGVFEASGTDQERRDLLISRTRKKLREYGLRVMASASFPPRGSPGAGRTVVLLVASWTEGRLEEVERVFAEAAKEVLGERTPE
jgi:hypothetical protein